MSIQLPERPPVYSEARGCQIKGLLMLHLFTYTAYEQFHRGPHTDRGPETMTLERFLLTLSVSLALSLPIFASQTLSMMSIH